MKTILPLFFCFILLSSCNIFSSDELFEGGKGTAENPYQISTAKQLQRIGEEENLDKHFIQVRDIDATETAEFNSGRGFQPIGNEVIPFTGSFNGNGFTISQLKLDRNEKHTGLFGYVKNSLIENVTIVNDMDTNCGFEKIRQRSKGQINPVNEFDDITLIENIQASGLLVGFNDSGIVRNSSSTGRFTVEGTHLGGFVGYNTGHIENSHFSGHAYGLNSYIGGLVGGNTGTIHNSFATGCASASRTAGGLAGVNFGGQISNSYAISRVGGSRAAGLVALQEGGQIQASYSSGEIMGTGDASGGLAAINQGEIKDSYSHSEFSESTESDNVGGIVGINKMDGTITTSYSAGKLTSELGSTIGGISGLNEGVIESSYWDETATGVNTGTGSGIEDETTGLTTEQITGPSARENMAEFDWMNIWTTTPDGYPVLRWQEDE